jgi:glyoxylase-like metal-dependent hydrolase (beta-lactamase superfamily II)
LDFQDINLIMTTHIHPDHFGLAGKLQELCQAELALHEIEKLIIDSSHEWTGMILEEMRDWLRLNGVPTDHFPELEDPSMGAVNLFAKAVPDRGLKHGEIVSTGIFDLQVYWTPGHSPGHMCLYEPAHKILFSGDHILPVITPNISIHAGTHGNPLGDYLESLKIIGGVNMKLGLPAHEEVFTDLPARINQLFIHHEDRKSEIIATIEDQSKTAYEVSSEISWMEGQITWDELGPLDKRIAVTEALAHLEALRIDNKIEKIEQEGLALYKAT